MGKTAPLARLVDDGMARISRPYSTDITDDVCLVIEGDSVLQERYNCLVDDLGKLSVNTNIGRIVANKVGRRTGARVRTPRSTLIGSYCKLE